jgi:hypothetical protein
MTWIYFTGVEGSAFKRISEFTPNYELWPQELYYVLSFMRDNTSIFDLSWQTDDKVTHILKRKREGETITAPR